jgi:hypothetical protein
MVNAATCAEVLEMMPSNSPLQVLQRDVPSDDPGNQWMKVQVVGGSGNTGYAAGIYVDCQMVEEGGNNQGGKVTGGAAGIEISGNEEVFQFTHFYNGPKKFAEIQAQDWQGFQDGVLDLNVFSLKKDKMWVKLNLKGSPTFAEMKLRGGLTLNTTDLDKKSFSLEFRDDSPRPQIQGDGKKRLIFNANANDPSFMRNFFALSLAKAWGAQAPDVYFYTPIKLRRIKTNYQPNPGVSTGYYMVIRHTKSIDELADAAKGDEARIYSPQVDVWDTWSNAHGGHFQEGGKNDGVKSKVGSPDEAAQILQQHCSGGEVFDRNDYYLWMAIGYLLADLDTHTKNFFYYRTNQQNYRFFHWDRDSILGYSPDGNEENEAILGQVRPYHRSPSVGQDVTCMEKGRTDGYNSFLNQLKSKYNQGQVLSVFDSVAAKINHGLANQDLQAGYWRKQVEVDGKPPRFMDSGAMQGELRRRLQIRMQQFGMP